MQIEVYNLRPQSKLRPCIESITFLYILYVIAQLPILD